MANKFRVEFQSAAHDSNDACVGFRWVEVETFEYEADAIACRDELDEDAPFAVRVVEIDDNGTIVR